MNRNHQAYLLLVGFLAVSLLFNFYLARENLDLTRENIKLMLENMELMRFIEKMIHGGLGVLE